MTPTLPPRIDPARGRQAVPLGSEWRRSLWWRVLMAVFFLAVALVIVSRAKQVDWPAVGAALRAYAAADLALGLVLSIAAYACASSYDLLARGYVGHRLSARRTFSINAVAYAFSLNLGALAGGWAFRLRLYTLHGVPAAQVAKLLLFVVVTNWSGFVLLAGLMLAFFTPALPDSWALTQSGLRVVGAGLLMTVAAYLVFCAQGTRRGWRLNIKGQSFEPPSLALGCAQLALSAGSWLLMGLALAALLPDALPFSSTLSALFGASLIGAATHVPGSVGVLEGGFTALVAGQIPEDLALAGVIAFRAMFYFVPFVFAAILYTLLERSGRSARAVQQRAPDVI